MRRIQPAVSPIRFALLASGAMMALATSQVHAANILFALGATAGGQPVNAGPVTPGQQIKIGDGTVQVKLDDGSMVSLVGGSFKVEADGSITVESGSVTTINGPGGGPVMLHLPGGVNATVHGSAGSATFDIDGTNIDGMSSSVRPMLPAQVAPLASIWGKPLPSTAEAHPA